MTGTKVIPTLTGSAAKRFNDMADRNKSNLNRVDFSDKVSALKSMLTKSNFILRGDEEVKNAQVKGYKYLIP